MEAARDVVQLEPRQQEHTYWHDTTAIIHKHCNPDTPLFGGADANASVGSRTSTATGNTNSEDESPAGTIFHTFRLRNHLSSGLIRRSVGSFGDPWAEWRSEDLEA